MSQESTVYIKTDLPQSEKTVENKYDKTINVSIDESHYLYSPNPFLESVVVHKVDESNSYNTLDPFSVSITEFFKLVVSNDFSMLNQSEYPAIFFKIYNNFDPNTLIYLYNLDFENNNPEKIKIFKFLIKKGANVNAQDDKGNTVLHNAIETNNVELAKLLIKNGANPYLKNKKNLSANAKKLLDQSSPAIKSAFKYPNAHLLKLVENNDFDTLSTLKYHPSYFDQCKDHKGYNLLTLACSKQSTQMIQALLDKGLDLLSTDNKFDFSALFHAAILDGSALKYLIDQNPRYLNRKEHNVCLLEVAVKYHKINNIKYLLEKNITVSDNILLNLFLSRSHINNSDKLEIAKLLIERGAKINAQDDKGNTVLHKAVETNNVELAKLLIENGANPYLKNKKNLSANAKKLLDQSSPAIKSAFKYPNAHLLKLVENNDFDTLSTLKYHPSYFDQCKDHKGYNLLTLACSKQSTQMIQALLDKGLDLLSTDNKFDFSALFHAAILDGSALKYLIDQNPRYLNRKEHNVCLLEVAVKYHKINNIKYLLEKNITVSDNILLNLFLSRSHINNSDKLEIAKLLIERGAKINAQDDKGNTVLHKAVETNNVELAKLLIENGANPYLKNKKNLSAIKLLNQKSLDQSWREMKSAFNYLNDHILKLVQNNDFSAVAKLSYHRSYFDQCKNEKGYNLLTLACSQSTQMIQALIDKGLDLLSIDNKFDHSALFHAASVGGPALKYLINKNSNLLAIQENNSNLLDIAVQFHKINHVEYLLNKQIAISNNICLKLFTFASQKNHSDKLKIAKLLIENGANVNVQDSQGNTPLHKVVETNDAKMAKLLIKNGADPHLKNNKNLSAKELSDQSSPEMRSAFNYPNDHLFKLIENKKINDLQKINYHKSYLANAKDMIIRKQKAKKIINIFNINTSINNNTPVETVIALYKTYTSIITPHFSHFFFGKFYHHAELAKTIFQEFEKNSTQYNTYENCSKYIKNATRDYYEKGGRFNSDSTFIGLNEEIDRRAKLEPSNEIERQTELEYLKPKV